MEIIGLLEKFVPEMIDLLENRYNILRTIYKNQPIGRRMLAERLGLGERVARGEIDFFKNRQMLCSGVNGVSLTPECEAVLYQLGELVHKMRGLASLEASLAEKMDLDKVFIVPGNLDEDHSVMQDLGRVAGHYVQKTVKDRWIVAVTGGSTMAEISNHIPEGSAKSGVLVVPARGGLGEDVEIQANTIAAKIARRLGAAYRLLHIPDVIHGDALDKLLAEPRIEEIIGLNKKADLLLHGIGVPRVMAKRRELDWDKLLDLAQKVPVGEAFGNYFSADGSVAMVTNTVGLKLEDLLKLKRVVAVAGGKSKAGAIVAVLKAGFVRVLITDQGAALKMREII